MALNKNTNKTYFMWIVTSFDKGVLPNKRITKNSMWTISSIAVFVKRPVTIAMMFKFNT